MRYIFLLLLIIASIGTFVFIINPRYKEVQLMRGDISSYQGRLQTAQKINSSREDLISRYNSIPKSDLDNLKTLLPDSVDNIRLIIQLDSLATKNGLSSLRSVSYDATKTEQNTKPDSSTAQQKSYGEFVISFETTGQYKNFLSFLSDLEENLRLVDVSEVRFASINSQSGPADSMRYTVTLKTYWLKK